MCLFYPGIEYSKKIRFIWHLIVCGNRPRTDKHHSLTSFLHAFKILLIQGGGLSDTIPFLNHLLIRTIVYGLLGYIAIKGKICAILRKERSGMAPQQIIIEEDVGDEPDDDEDHCRGHVETSPVISFS